MTRAEWIAFFCQMVMLTVFEHFTGVHIVPMLAFAMGFFAVGYILAVSTLRKQMADYHAVIREAEALMQQALARKDATND